MAGPTVYWEDVAVGAAVSGGAFEFTAEDIKRFAAEFDPRPTHLDDASAEASFFGGLTASGAHTFACWARLYGEITPHWANQAGAEIRKMRLPRPVRPGDVLSLAMEITGKRISPMRRDAGFIDQHHEMRNQEGRVVFRMECMVMIDKRPRGGTAV